MKSNGIELIIGPIEDYEDVLYGRKTAHSGVVLLKDREWSARLNNLTGALPELQRGLPVSDAYKRETPGSDGELGVYDAVAYAGHANAIPPDAINLPNDEDLQLTKGTRRLQLRNAMCGNFDHTIVPVANSLIAADQRSDVRFEAYFAYVMCHEIAHGLGIKYTIDATGSVREALRDQHGVVEEGKADIVGLHLLERLKTMGKLPDASLASVYLTFVAEMLKQIRRGSASEYARAGLANLSFLLESGAVNRDRATGTFGVDVAVMRGAIDSLAERYLRLQGDGDYHGALTFIPKEMELGPTLTVDVDRLAAAKIPMGIRFVPATDLSIVGTRS
jgi:hypothetical protein